MRDGPVMTDLGHTYSRSIALYRYSQLKIAQLCKYQENFPPENRALKWLKRLRLD